MQRQTFGFGVAVMLGDTHVCASSTTQHYATLLTSEAEYVAMSHGPKSALAIKAVLNFVQTNLSGSGINMYDDNEGAKAPAQNPKGSHRSKHIDVRYHFLRGLVKLEHICVHSAASAKQHADTLTKFRRHREFLANLS